MKWKQCHCRVSTQTLAILEGSLKGHLATQAGKFHEASRAQVHKYGFCRG